MITHHRFNPFFRYRCGRFHKSGKKVVMRKIKKRRVCNDHSYFSYLPDEIVLLILNKIIDLKTLCRCKLVSTQFNLIVHQVHTVSFVANSPADDPSRCHSDPSVDDDDDGLPKKLLHSLSKPFYYSLRDDDVYRGLAASYDCESFRSAIQSMSKFTRLKSLCIELPSIRKDVDNGCDLYKWKVEFGSKVESLVILSPNSVCDMKAGLSNNVDGNNGLDTVEQHDPSLRLKYERLGIDCLMDAAVRFRMLLGCSLDFPLLEKVCITQSGKRGSVSISGQGIVEMRKWLRSPTDSLEQKLRDSMGLPSKFCRFHVPLLKLPVSGYVMKGVNLIMIQREFCDGFVNINLDDNIEDQEEAAYGEAMMEMLKLI